MSELFKLTKDFQNHIKPPFDASTIIKELGDWIRLHEEALLLAWFAEYGFSPGKAVLVHSYTPEEKTFYIRESTQAENEARAGGSAEYKENEALKASLVLAYELVHKYWNENASSDFNGDEAKELRRDIWDKCLAPHGIPHPRGWAT